MAAWGWACPVLLQDLMNQLVQAELETEETAEYLTENSALVSSEMMRKIV